MDESYYTRPNQKFICGAYNHKDLHLGMGWDHRLSRSRHGTGRYATFAIGISASFAIDAGYQYGWYDAPARAAYYG